MSRSDWEIPYLRKKHLSLMFLTAITAEGKNKWLKSSILPASIKRWCCIRHFETQSNHTSFLGRTLPLRAHSEALDNSETVNGKLSAQPRKMDSTKGQY